MPPARAVANVPSIEEQQIAACELLLSMFEEHEKRAAQQALPCWTPQPGPQRQLFESEADEILFGGAAGGGKSAAIVALLTQRIMMRGYRALILRRTSDDLSHLFDEARWIFHEGRPYGSFAYKPFAAIPDTRWFDGSWLISKENGRARFGHCHNDDDYKKYIGLQWDDVLFDELPHFTLKQYTEIIGRRRGTIPGLRRRAVSTANPPEQDDPGVEWIKVRWGPWLDDDFEFEDWELTDHSTGEVVRGKGLPARWEETRGADGQPALRRRPPAASAQVLYVAMVGEGEEARERFSTEPFSWRGAAAETRTFIASKMSDNQALLEAEPNYVAKLRQNDPVRAQQLELGDWSIKPAPGLYFKRSWFEVVDEVPPGRAEWLRRWDLAASVPTRENPDPDWTVGYRVALHEDGYLYVDDAVFCRKDPGETDAFIRQVAGEQDGDAVLQVFAIDPGAAGKRDAPRVAQMVQALGLPAECERERGAKSLRIRYLSTVASPANNDRADTTHDGKPAATKLGRIKIVRGDWNERLLRQATSWEPRISDEDRGHDDDLDALAGAVKRHLAGGGTASVSVEVIGGGRAA